MGLPSRWVSHLSNQDQDSKANFESAVRNSTTALYRLKDILLEDLDAIERVENSEKQFEDPNWSHKQAFWNGQRSRLHSILSLLNFDQERK